MTSAFGPLPAAAWQAAVGAFYAAATDEDQLHPGLRHLNAALGAQACQLTLRPARGGALVLADGAFDGPAPDAQRFLGLAAGAALQAAPHLLVARLAWPDGGGSLAVQRAAGQPAFGPADVAALDSLLPHLARALALRARLQAERAAAHRAADLFESLPAACIVTDQAGRCLQMTAGFRAQVVGCGLRLATGRVRLGTRQAQRLWETALAEAHLTGLPQAVQLNAAPLRTWQVQIRPWLPDDSAEPAGTRLLLASFEEVAPPAQVDPAALAGAARLTQAELDVLSSLLKGLPAKAIAGQRGASVNTVRSQIVAILEKTGFRSQRALIASFGASSFEHSTSSFAVSSRHRANA